MKMNEKVENESEGILVRLENMEKRLTALVDEKSKTLQKPHAKNWKKAFRCTQCEAC